MRKKTKKRAPHHSGLPRLGWQKNLAATQQRKASRIDGSVDLDQIVSTHVDLFLSGNTRKFGSFGDEDPAQARLDEPGFYVVGISGVTQKYRAGEPCFGACCDHANFH